MHIDALGGPAIFAYNVARTLSVFALLALSVAGLLSGLAKSQEDQQIYLALCLVYVRQNQTPIWYPHCCCCLY